MKTIITNAFLPIVIYFLISSTAIAQENISNTNDKTTYKNAIGLRLGWTSGITYNHKFNEKNSIKFILGAFPYSYGLTCLYERYHSTIVSGLNYYYGIGGHVSGAYYRTWHYYNTEGGQYSYYRTYGTGAILGIDLIGGLEYKFPNVPFAVNLDLKPYAEFFNGYGPFLNPDLGVGIKFVF
jgi:hypothetical protein